MEKSLVQFLITGGTSGIGCALAEAFHAEGNQVIITGRRKHLLDEITAMNPGMKAVVLDVENSDAIASFAEQLKIDHPDLNIAQAVVFLCSDAASYITGQPLVIDGGFTVS